MKIVLPERISERICELSGVVEVPRISCKDQILQSTREQFLDVPVPRLIEQFVDVPKIVFQDRIRQRTFEQFADIPVFKVVSQDRVQHSFVEQNIESAVDQILDVPVPQVIDRAVLTSLHLSRISASTLPVFLRSLQKESAWRLENLPVGTPRVLGTCGWPFGPFPINLSTTRNLEILFLAWSMLGLHFRRSPEVGPSSRRLLVLNTWRKPSTFLVNVLQFRHPGLDRSAEIEQHRFEVHQNAFKP